ncbi:MAG: acyl-CoA dehydrogenase [Ornithinimicrobium sp.]
MPSTPPWCFSEWGDRQLAERVRLYEPDVDVALGWLSSEPWLNSVTSGPDLSTLSALATLGSIDVSIARATEPHLDATAILSQAEHASPRSTYAPEPGATWGVYAASPPGTTVQATSTDNPDRWTLTGRKLWCSLADRLSHALVTAPTEDGDQRLFAIRLNDPSVQLLPAQWQAHGLRDISTGSIDFEQTPAAPIGGPGWYLNRPGFSWGGVAVSAVWFGAAAALAGALWRAASHRKPDQIALMHLGRCDRLLHSALLCLRDAVAVLAPSATSPQDAAVSAARTRAHVADVAEEILTTVGHALGPGPLAFDAEHIRRVSDLTLYVRQHHAERDLARLGTLMLPDTTEDLSERQR